MSRSKQLARKSGSPPHSAHTEFGLMVELDGAAAAEDWIDNTKHPLRQSETCKI